MDVMVMELTVKNECTRGSAAELLVSCLWFLFWHGVNARL